MNRKPGSGRLRGVLVVGLTLSLALTLAGCGGYPEVSPAAFELSKAVFHVCNARQPEQLDAARATIRTRRDAGQISDRESRYLLDILATAESGDWRQAETQARRLLRDQTDW